MLLGEAAVALFLVQWRNTSQGGGSFKDISADRGSTVSVHAR
jgi:hypothetical protein